VDRLIGIDGSEITEEQALAQATEFAATVAHEMRTPLHTASGFLAFLLQGMAGPLSVMQRDMLASVATSLEQAQLLTEDLLSMAALDNGQLSFDLQPLDLRELVREELKQLQLMAEAANVTLEETSLEGVEYRVMGVRSRLGQCLRNLLVNAIKFSPTGGKVRVVLEPCGPDYMVSIEDKGPGISPEYQERIFERGFQVRSDGRHLKGYGLGLAVSRELVEHQGGQLGVESALGEGSRFWIKLPRARQ
jgi:signal transduction histidine kinase